jgi:hypothetical protein
LAKSQHGQAPATSFLERYPNVPACMHRVLAASSALILHIHTYTYVYPCGACLCSCCLTKSSLECIHTFICAHTHDATCTLWLPSHKIRSITYLDLGSHSLLSLAHILKGYLHCGHTSRN